MNNKELYEDYMKTSRHPWLGHVKDVFDKYVEVWNETRVERNSHHTEDKYLYPYCDFDCVDHDEVLFYGEETWQYGGYAEHRVNIPLDFFLCDDDSLLESLRKAREQRKKEVLKSREEDERERKRKLLEKLQGEVAEGKL